MQKKEKFTEATLQSFILSNIAYNMDIQKLVKKIEEAVHSEFDYFELDWENRELDPESSVLILNHGNLDLFMQKREVPGLTYYYKDQNESVYRFLTKFFRAGEEEIEISVTCCLKKPTGECWMYDHGTENWVNSDSCPRCTSTCNANGN